MVRWIGNISLFLLGSLLLFGSVDAFLKSRELDRRGKTALVAPPAEFIETTTVKKKLGVKFDESKSYTANVTFVDADNHMVTIGNKSIPKEELARFQSGEPVYVRYLPDDPKGARFTSEGSGALMMLGFAVAMFGILYFLVSSDRRKARETAEAE